MRVARAADRSFPGRNAPFGCRIERTGNASSRHQTTSVTSPNVQIIATPDPFSGSAR